MSTTRRLRPGPGHPYNADLGNGKGDDLGERDDTAIGTGKGGDNHNRARDGNDDERRCSVEPCHRLHSPRR